MFELAGKLELVATSSDASMLAALELARADHAARRDHIPLPPPLAARTRTRALRSRRGTGGARSPTAAIPAWWSGGTSRRWCSPTWPRSCDRGHRGRRGRGVRRLAGQPAALGGVRAAAGGVLRRGWAARHGGGVHRAAAARPPGRRCRAGRWVRGQRRPGDRRGRRSVSEAAAAGDPGGGGETGGGGRAADAGAVAAVDRGPHRVLAAGTTISARRAGRTRRSPTRWAGTAWRCSPAGSTSARTRRPGTSPGCRPGSCRWSAIGTST